MTTPFPLRSVELMQHGSALLQLFRQWSARWHDLLFQWQQAQDVWTGTAATQAQQQLRALYNGSAQQSRIMQQLAALLFATQPLQSFLDDAWERIQLWRAQLQHVPQVLVDHNPVISAILRDLQRAGDFLDQACARQIGVITGSCTPHSYSTAAPTQAEIHEEFPDATILALDEHQAIVAFGDLANAQDITTFVAGVGSSNPQRWRNSFVRAENIATHTQSATIAWLGYAAPPNVTGGLAREPALQGATKLRAFQQQLRTEYPEADLHVLGHSYGSTVVGTAAAQGLAADSLIVVGSPGIPDNIRLHTRDGAPGSVIGVLNHRDPIGLTGTNDVALHGIDPGARAQGHNNPVHAQWFFEGDHSSYFEDPAFLAALRDHLQQS